MITTRTELTSPQVRPDLVSLDDVDGSGPVVFLSKCLGMLPVIWTDDDAESDCKSYFNLYTFIVFLAWIGVAVISGFRVNLIDPWPSSGNFSGDNSTDSKRFMGRVSLYKAGVFYVMFSINLVLVLTTTQIFFSCDNSIVIVVPYSDFRKDLSNIRDYNRRIKH